jgi:hypothetical protein
VLNDVNYILFQVYSELEAIIDKLAKEVQRGTLPRKILPKPQPLSPLSSNNAGTNSMSPTKGEKEKRKTRPSSRWQQIFYLWSEYEGFILITSLTTFGRRCFPPPLIFRIITTTQLHYFCCGCVTAFVTAKMWHAAARKRLKLNCNTNLSVHVKLDRHLVQ